VHLPVRLAVTAVVVAIAATVAPASAQASETEPVSPSIAGTQQAADAVQVAFASSIARAPVASVCFGATAMDPRKQPCMPDASTTSFHPSVTNGRGDNVVPRGRSCRSSAGSLRVLKCTFLRSAHMRVALVGDSHAEQWLPAVIAVARTNHWRLDTYLKGGCAFSTTKRSDNATASHNSCIAWGNKVQKKLLAGRYDLVITSAVTGTTYARAAGKTSEESAAAGLVRRWNALADGGIEVVAIRDSPHPRQNIHTCLHRLGSTAFQRQSLCGMSRASVLRPDPQISAAQQSGAGLVDLTPYFCIGTTCPAVIGSVIVYRDDSHMGGVYSRSLAPYLGERVLAIMRDYQSVR
jgi:hypothetical protein